jgi:cell division protein FtsL
MPRRAIAAAMIVVVAIALLQVAQSSGFAHTGQTMQRLEQEKVDLTAQVHALEAEVAALSSLERTERAARERLGMVPARTTDYLNVNLPAPTGVLLPRPLAATPTPDERPDNWWQAVVRALPFR